MNGTKLLSLAVAAAFVAAGMTPIAANAEGTAKTHSVHRSKGADGAVDATHTGPNGGSSSVDRSKNADGTTNAVKPGPQGQVSTVARSKDATGATDANRTNPKGTCGGRPHEQRGRYGRQDRDDDQGRGEQTRGAFVRHP